MIPKILDSFKMEMFLLAYYTGLDNMKDYQVSLQMTFSQSERQQCKGFQRKIMVIVDII